MKLGPVASGAVVLGAAGIIFIGARFLLDPEAAAKGFGLPSAPNPYLQTKGVRDIATGVFILTLFTISAFRALGWFFTAAAIIPLGDMLIVLNGGGQPRYAFAVHGLTAVTLVALGQWIVYRSRRYDASISKKKGLELS